MSELVSTDLPGDVVLDADLCIVGAGAVGLTMARELAGTNLRVLLLESGIANRACPPPAVVRGPLAPGGRRYHDPVVQPLYAGEAAGLLARADPDFALRSRSRCLGGSTNCWDGWLRPLDPVDFEPRPGWPPGWPFGRGELVPYYRRALKICGLEPEAFALFESASGEPWAKREAARAQRIDLTRILIMDPRGELGFDRRLGDEVRRAGNVVLLRNANVVELEMAGGEVATAAVVAVDPVTRRAGRRLSVTARAFVLASGGIENVRLLAVSRPGPPAGWLGAGFMCHPLYANALSFRPGPGGLPAGLLAFFSQREGPGCLLRGALASAPDDARGDGEGAFRSLLLADPAGHDRCSVSVDWEQRPDRSNRIELCGRDPVLDRPAVRITWGLTAADRHTLESALGRLAGFLHVTAGARELRAIDLDGQGWPLRDLAGEPLYAGEHHLGGTRMATRPADGVVDPDGRLFDAPNLFVTGASVFPRAGHANPTLTILALALRLADHLQRSIVPGARGGGSEQACRLFPR